MNDKKGSFFLGLFLIIALVVGGAIVLDNSNPSSSGSGVTGGAVSGSGTVYYTNTDDPSCGDYGQPCCSGECDQGECQGGMCIHCGYFGETCCYQDVDGMSCDQGSTCFRGRCKVTEEYNYYNECGHIGFPPCQDDYGYYCSYGVYNSRAGVCEHCGFLEQPCCPNTDYECDYGTCINGICKLTKQRASPSTNTNNQPYDSSDSYSTDSPNNNPPAASNSCGSLDENCCESGIQQSMWGGVEATPQCDYPLECIGEVCVNGPTFESAPRGSY